MISDILKYLAVVTDRFSKDIPFPMSIIYGRLRRFCYKLSSSSICLILLVSAFQVGAPACLLGFRKIGCSVCTHDQGYSIQLFLVLCLVLLVLIFFLKHFMTHQAIVLFFLDQVKSMARRHVLYYYNIALTAESTHSALLC